MEKVPSLESMAIAAFRIFAERGVTRPEELDYTDSATQEAEAIVEQWVTQNPEEAQTSLRDMIYIRAGFHDPDYLDEVKNDWLVQDLDKFSNKPNLVSQIEAARDEIERILSDNPDRLPEEPDKE